MSGFLISHVKLYDGTGAPARTADVAVSNGVIAGISQGGTVPHSSLKKIDGEGGAVFGRWDKFAALPPDLRRRFMADDGLTPARGVIMEPDNTFESHIRRTSAENPKKLRGLRKKKMLLLVVPPPR